MNRQCKERALEKRLFVYFLNWLKLKCAPYIPIITSSSSLVMTVCCDFKIGLLISTLN